MLDFFASTEIIDYNSLIVEAAVDQMASNAKLNGSIIIELYGTPIDLSKTGGIIDPISFNPEYFDLTASFHMLGTYDPDVLRGENFIFH